jgi:hypothetical protein
VRDFDAERQERHAERERLLGDRQIKIGGEVFTYEANVSYDVLRRLTSDVPLQGEAYITAIEQSVLDLIVDEDGSHKKFLQMCKRKKDPITFDDLQLLCTSLVEMAFSRPTEASLPSTGSDAESGTSSTDSKSTAQAEALVA